MFDWGYGGQTIKNEPSQYQGILSSWVNNTDRNGSWFTDLNGDGDCYTMAMRDSHNQVEDNDAMLSWDDNGPCR